MTVIPSMTQKDWTVFAVNGGITLWTKDFPGSKVRQFKLKTVVKKDIQTAYQVLKDVEHMNLWYDRVNSVSLLKKISENEGIYLLEYGLPFPFENRISTINGKLDFDAKAGKLVVQTNYITHKVPSEKSDMVLINEISSNWQVTKQVGGDIEIIHSGHMNPGGNIPLWLINDGVTSGPFKTMKAFIKMFDKYK